MPAPAASAGRYPAGDTGARELLEKVGTKGDSALVESLRPTSADYRAVFRPDFAGRAERFYRTRFWGGSPVPPGPWAQQGQTELKMWKATTEEIRDWTPAVRSNFPGGYADVKDEFNSGLTVYTWRYTRPGAERGLFFNGLVHVNGHWALFPKPWYVLHQ
ncbi:hypothetical protein C6376_27320 [Streptomyces sp. P3]|uniref:hypothetical protein n=1 Tax=Streptomyces sp. P3 TaxID=2135430 RepID=UPI000D199F23|nr:hypothetical protein [Streptomyces sp. P3]AVV44596.1 hypothetical protein C6376_27320 [Streptomyces sp. P3]